MCIDDVGLHAGIQAAATVLVAQGRVHALSLMVGAPALAAALPWLRGLAAADVDIGLHLDFTQHPLHPGSRRGLGALLVASALHRLPPDALRVEIAAQLDAFAQALGRPPAFVDGHQHVHQLPQLREALLDVLAARGDRPRPWLRSTRAPAGGDAKAWLLQHLGGRGLAARARARGHAMNRQLLGVYDFHGGAARYRRLLAGWLQAAGRADLLMCHPAASAPADDAIGAARLAELEVLAGPELPALLQAHGLALAPLSRALRG